MIYFLVPIAHEFCIQDYLALHGAALGKDFCVLHYEDLLRRKEFARGTFVLSALDQLNAANLYLLKEIYRQLKDVPGIRFLNNPLTTLQRFDLLTELNRQGLNDFRAVRAGDDRVRLRFPVFLRNERIHGGAISPLLNSEREIQQAIGRALVQGHKLSEVLVVEFCDTANEAGYYRKYAAFIVGGKIIPRSLNYGREWMLKHSQTEFTMAMVLEELDYVTQNPHAKQLAKIFAVAQVDYGRIDYSMKDGRVQTWEINLNPTIGRGLRPRSRNIGPELDAIRDKVRAHFYNSFQSGWDEVNLSAESAEPIEIAIDPKLIKAARTKNVDENRLLSATRTMLRPAKPLIEPLAPPFLRLLSSLARLSQRKHQ
jgi:hypothetical protein